MTAAKESEAQPTESQTNTDPTLNGYVSRHVNDGPTADTETQGGIKTKESYPNGETADAGIAQSDSPLDSKVFDVRGSAKSLAYQAHVPEFRIGYIITILETLVPE